MATNLGQCDKCRAANSYKAINCIECGARLPWADAIAAHPAAASGSAHPDLDFLNKPAQPVQSAAAPPNYPYQPQQSICERCGWVGQPQTYTPGSIAIEILLWLAFLLPGILYSCWRLISRTKACPTCKGVMLPLTTPRGQMLHKQFYN